MSSIVSLFSALTAVFFTGVTASVPSPAPVENVRTSDVSTALEYSTWTMVKEDVAAFDAAAHYAYGKAKTRITVFEFSDPHCPYCRMIHKDKTLEKIVDASKGAVSLRPSYFPLDFHQGAKEESVAGICYGKLGGKTAYLNFRHEAFSRDSQSYDGRYSSEELAAYAEKYGIDAEKYASCVADGAVTKSLEESMAKASSYGIAGTPGYLIVNRDTGKYVLISGAYPLETFVKAVREAAK